MECILLIRHGGGAKKTFKTSDSSRVLLQSIAMFTLVVAINRWPGCAWNVQLIQIVLLELGHDLTNHILGRVVTLFDFANFLCLRHMCLIWLDTP